MKSVTAVGVFINFENFLFYDLNTGHEATESVNILNNEDLPFHFSFADSSLHSPGYSSHLYLEPMSGVIQPKSR